MRQFLTRLDTAARALRNANDGAILAIFIDAADNAEMAAQEFGHSCFVHELLREQVPDSSRIIALCRTERVHLLNPSNSTIQVLLEPFTIDETSTHLSQHIAGVSEADSIEFHRLTGGNPRVQANSLDNVSQDITQILTALGPAGSTVEDQIEALLTSAVSRLKDQLPAEYQSHTDSICAGLATLPPLIPLEVLAVAANVSQEAVKSFIADLGRPLWLSDTSVQFRDEPSETWFRKAFFATVEQVASYITRIRPLADDYSYVAEALPSLLLQAEMYDELVNLALSDESLPKDNPIDARNIRVYRLQFAFKAALKLKRYADATKLAMRAGEEVAGDKRQLQLLAKNVDLIAPLQSAQRVQELAFRRLLRGEWNGSENVYSASLLSFIDDFRGEARGYLRSADNWLHLYFDERKQTNDKHGQETLQDDDLVELLFAYYNLFGVERAIEFLSSWRPPEVAYRLAVPFIKKLVDAGSFDEIDAISRIGSRNPYLMIAIARELLEVGRFPNVDALRQCLDLLTVKRTRIPKPGFRYDDTTAAAILSFAEACAAYKLPTAQILRVLRHYFSPKASRSVSHNFQTKERNIYLRSVALKSVLTGDLEPVLDELLPVDWVENKHKHDNQQNIEEFKKIVGGILPWHIMRAQLINGGVEDLFTALRDASERSRNALSNRWREFDRLPYEISQIQVEIMALHRFTSHDEIDRYLTDYVKENKQLWIQDRLKAVRVAFRSEHLATIRRQLEEFAFREVSTISSEAPETKAEWYIDLARALLPIDRNDASAYFDYAIEAVSKFGDELVERWEAVAAIANRLAEARPVSPELAYRFIRCAELIGDNVTREKYFDRDEAIRTCVRLFPISALSAFSRWRDRGIGWFYRQLSALASEIVGSGVASPTTAWALSAFFQGYGLDDFAILCMSKEQSRQNQQLIMDIAVRDLRMSEADESTWKKLKQAAMQFSLNTIEVDRILSFYANKPQDQSEIASSSAIHPIRRDETEEFAWEELFSGIDLTTSHGLSNALQAFAKAERRYLSHNAFWQEVYTRIDERDAEKFLWALVDAERASKFDVQSAISQMPDDWKRKASIKRNWDRFFEAIARRFAAQITHRYILRYYLKELGIDNSVMPAIRAGIIDGLSRYDNLLDASTFFGFSEIGSTFISPKEAEELLDYALKRFELHIDDEYGDGIWANWLVPPDDIREAYAGFVWAALGSPRSEERWRAAHCVRRLAQANCVSEIDALMEWMERDEIGAFGSHTFPFYNLHARQYLLIALARVSIDNPYVLVHHSSIFVRYAVESLDHALIQKFSTDIALNIEKAFPGTYGPDIRERLAKIGVSQLPITESQDLYKCSFTSPWHEQGKVNLQSKFLHGWDFDSYWFEPLGRVFGISGKQIEELATGVIIDEWEVRSEVNYYTDPRSRVWRQDERETWHSHGSYPRSDNFSFYLSYHAMLVVASRLLQQMSVVHRHDWNEDAWMEWLQGHILTRPDGYWLSDSRNPAPLYQRPWSYQKKSTNWRWEIVPADFLDGLFIERNGETWLNVYGWWQESDGERDECFRISSALVLSQASQSLLNALTTGPADDSMLSGYEEDQTEFEIYLFNLQGWVWCGHTDEHLDSFDPHAGTIPYPPYQIGEFIIEKLGLNADSDLQKWFIDGTNQTAIICDLWGTDKSRQDEDPLRQGNRLSASLAFLKRVCTVFECEMIFKIQISRTHRQQQYSRSEDEIGYIPSYSKIYLLSGDGKLRDTRTHIQIRESLS